MLTKSNITAALIAVAVIAIAYRIPQARQLIVGA